MNVRFFAGTREQYNNIATHNKLALYFCSDTRELFWGDLLLTDGTRVVPTYDKLPDLATAADGIIYYVIDTRAGYIKKQCEFGLEWLQVISATADNTPEIDLSEYSTTAEMNSAISNAVALKANKVLFTTQRFVSEPIGSFKVGDNVKDLTISQIIAKLLGLKDTMDDPETGTLAETLLANKTPMYSITADGILAEVPFQELDGNDAPEASGFFVIRNDAGEIIKAGYQDLSVLNDELYYVIALPKELDYNTMVTLEAWDSDEQVWVESSMNLINDPTIVADLCAEAGITISNVDTNLFTIWLYEDICTGSILRYVIKES